MDAPDFVVADELGRLEEDEDQSGDYFVHPDNWDAFLVFMGCFGSLRANHYIPATEIESVMRLRLVPDQDRSELYESVRIIEQGYLENLKPHGNQTIQDRAAYHGRRHQRR